MNPDPSHLPSELPPPPPGGALAAALDDLHPVRTRVPGRSFVVVLAVSLVSAAIAVALAGVRPDARALPLWWLLGMGGLWALAGPFLLARAILPPAGQVLPDAARAARSAAVIATALILLGLFGSVDAPGVTAHASSFLGGFWHCTKTTLRIVLPVLLAGGLVLRHLHPMGAGRIAAALGAAGGAWAGLVLHVICALGGGAHVGLAHGGATVIGAAMGAVVLGRLLR
jgi:hypothetical protein